MRIEVICTGDEVLTGKIVNTNYAYIAQKLEDYGFSVRRGLTVGDDREALLQSFLEAGARSDAVVVNGGLGPTVDDLSQEVAAQAAGVELVLNQDWMGRMEAFFAQRGRVMPENNIKQAMLPQGGELLENPIGTACGFAVTINDARFFFTPGVPRELHRMLEQEIVPRLLRMSGAHSVIQLKRFHSFGLGESHVDALLAGLEAMVPDGSVKLGFRAHYPQLETKLTVRAATAAEARAKLAPVEAEVRRRVGNFILAEDDETLEGVVLRLLSEGNATLAVVEDFTGGQISARIATLPGAEAVLRRGLSSRSLPELLQVLQVEPAPPFAAAEEAAPLSETLSRSMAQAVRRQARVTHGLAVLVELEEGRDGGNLTGTVCLAVATEDDVVSRRSRLAGGRDWVRLGAVELALDSLRRYLRSLPLKERIDFEKPAG